MICRARSTPISSGTLTFWPRFGPAVRCRRPSGPRRPHDRTPKAIALGPTRGPGCRLNHLSEMSRNRSKKPYIHAIIGQFLTIGVGDRETASCSRLITTEQSCRPAKQIRSFESYTTYSR